MLPNTPPGAFAVTPAGWFRSIRGQVEQREPSLLETRSQKQATATDPMTAGPTWRGAEDQITERDNHRRQRDGEHPRLARRSPERVPKER